jgi:hypothetical protein
MHPHDSEMTPQLAGMIFEHVFIGFPSNVYKDRTQNSSFSTVYNARKLVKNSQSFSSLKP